jgi:hypothetical protein
MKSGCDVKHFFLHGLELRHELFRVLKELGKSGSFGGIAPGQKVEHADRRIGLRP